MGNSSRGSLYLGGGFISAVEYAKFEKRNLKVINREKAVMVGRHNEDSAEIVGRHPDDYVDKLSERFGLPPRVRRRIRGIQSGIYIRLWREEARLMDGASDLLPWLVEQGYRLALATRSNISRSSSPGRRVRSMR